MFLVVSKFRESRPHSEETSLRYLKKSPCNPMFKMLNYNLSVFLRCKSIGFPAKFHFVEVIEGVKIKGVFLFLLSERPIPMPKRPIFFLTFPWFLGEESPLYFLPLSFVL